jgi:NAD(P)-dependent dehydrogenase (short-subunit alcohol dehydrogenase family)
MASANRDCLDFNGKVVLITGAATGIGRAVTVGFAGRGAKIAIGDINEAAATETLDLIKRAGVDVLFLRTNVAEEADVQKLVSAARHASVVSTAHSTTPPSATRRRQCRSSTGLYLTGSSPLISAACSCV